MTDHAIDTSPDDRERLVHLLTERIKELSALREAARLVQLDYTAIADLMTPMVALLPPAFQRPSATEARIVYAGEQWATPRYGEGGVPLSAAFRTADGTEGRIDVRVIGDAADTHPFLVEEQQLLDSLADMLETRLNRRLAEQARRSSEARLRLLLDINNLILSEITFDSLLTVVSATLQRLVAHDHVALTLFDPDTRTMRLEAWMAVGGRPTTDDARRLPIDGSLEGLAFQRNTPVMVSASELEAFGAEGAPVLVGAGMRTACALPLVTGRRAVGVLTVASVNAEAFSRADVDLLKQIAGQIAIGVENAIAYGALAGVRDKLAEEKQYLEEEIRNGLNFSDIIGRSPAMRRVLQLVQSVAPTDATVLLLGETGTGKELLARAVHNLSPRRPHTFVKLNSAALPDQLFESELFGYEQGAFTGATSSKAGRLELAHRGSLFLDEIGDLPLDLQVKLLRVLQEREFERLGSHRTIQIDLRLIAATNRDLSRLVADGGFRADLYYRLNVFPIQVPPLRERREDIPLLVEHFLAAASRDLKRRGVSVPPGTMDALMRWHWPGNIRELQNTVERALILSAGNTLTLPTGLLELAANSGGRRRDTDADSVAQERNAILTALRSANGIVAGSHGAAAILGLKRTTLLARMRRLGISRGLPGA